jgi:hypothetical protein
MQLWLSLRDFMASSASWTEEAVLDDDGGLLLEIEAIRCIRCGTSQPTCHQRNPCTAINLPSAFDVTTESPGKTRVQGGALWGCLMCHVHGQACAVFLRSGIRHSFCTNSSL